MRITINFTDHRYHTYDFEPIDKLPEIGSVIDHPGDYKRTLVGYRDVTNQAARQDFGDGGYFELYFLYYHDEIYVVDEEDEAGNEIFYLEDDGESVAFVAIWVPYQDEED